MTTYFVLYPLGFSILFLFFGRHIGISQRILLSLVFMSGLFNIIGISLFYFSYKTGDIIETNLWSWFIIENFIVRWGISVNLVSITMLFLVCVVSNCVLIFSIEYMKSEPHLMRFLGYIYLFVFFMNSLIVSPNLLQFFFGWEGIGICSYLLVGFWNTRNEALKASIKAMLVNKVGDICFLIGMGYIWKYHGTLNILLINSLSAFKENHDSLSYAVNFFLIAVFCKSAQFPFHTWLPCAMEGPTPVSALIHAATMVTAGVLLIIRMSPVFEVCPTQNLVLLYIGANTSLFAAIVGLCQRDIKKIVAYSTMSQLGYMVMVTGICHYEQSFIHLINHGFFKALLFLSCGIQIHAFRGEQNIKKMGNVGYINAQTVGFIIGSLALIAFPATSGYYSKEIIIELVHNGHISGYVAGCSWLSAIFTCAYSIKAFWFGFLSKPQGMPYHYYPKTSNWISRLCYNFPIFILSLFSIFFGYYNSINNWTLLTPPMINYLQGQFLGYIVIKFFWIYMIILIFIFIIYSFLPKLLKYKKKG